MKNWEDPNIEPNCTVGEIMQATSRSNAMLGNPFPRVWILRQQVATVRDLYYAEPDPRTGLEVEAMSVLEQTLSFLDDLSRVVA